MDKSYQIPAGFLNRKMFREQAGISEHDLKSLEGQGLVKSTRRNNFGWRLYSTSDVDRVRRLAADLQEKRATRSAGMEEEPRLTPAYQEPIVAYTLEQYRAVYTEIEAGTAIDKIPMNVEIHPSIVTVILKDAKHLAGAFVVAKPIVEAINRLALPDIGAITKGEDLLEAFEKLGDALDKPPPCARCEKQPKRVCLDCAEDMYRPKKKKTVESAATINASIHGATKKHGMNGEMPRVPRAPRTPRKPAAAREPRVPRAARDPRESDTPTSG